MICGNIAQFCNHTTDCPLYMLTLRDVFLLPWLRAEIIDDIHDHVDRTDHRLIRETQHVRLIDRKSASCCEYRAPALLFL